MIERKDDIALIEGGAEKMQQTGKKSSICDYTDIILEALYDYRRWFSEADTETDKDRVKRIDEAIDFVKCS